ncbi:hypothetical protein INT46_001790 [Mucor plumbeus]|uniref:Uncharacterized protein n=1 Tax=Mucor plumbeus TaxID=97098 RepID=A0A8H7QR43_9FUNG|nr:hypothetical protein INT46_001790 [Mucor plumbeus]
MPMQKDLEKIHEKLQKILEQSEALSNRKYTPDDVHNLQERLRNIDAKYKEGIIDDQDKQNLNDDPYEHEGQAVVAEDIAKVHEKLSQLLQKVDN